MIQPFYQQLNNIPSGKYLPKELHLSGLENFKKTLVQNQNVLREVHKRGEVVTGEQGSHVVTLLKVNKIVHLHHQVVKRHVRAQ